MSKDKKNLEKNKFLLQLLLKGTNWTYFYPSQGVPIYWPGGSPVLVWGTPHWKGPNTRNWGTATPIPGKDQGPETGVPPEKTRH